MDSGWSWFFAAYLPSSEGVLLGHLLPLGGFFRLFLGLIQLGETLGGLLQAYLAVGWDCGFAASGMADAATMRSVTAPSL